MTSQEQLDAKRRRVSRACDTCRRKKVRCDGIQPACTNCITFGFQCTFNDSAKKRGPPKGYIEALENRLHRMESLLGGLVHTGDRPRTDIDNWRSGHDGSSAGGLGGDDHDDDLDSLDTWAPTDPPHNAHPSSSSNNSTGTTSSVHPPGHPSHRAESPLAFNHSPEPEDDFSTYNESARKKINALSESMDSMTLDEGAFSRYLGNSSGIDLLQKNQLLKNGYLMVPLKQKDYHDWQLETEAALAQLTSQMTMPPRDLADHLIDTYWTYIHPHMPILHKPLFMRQYKNADPEKRPPAVLLNAMFSIASRFSDHPEIVGLSDPEDFGVEYFSRAKRLVDLDMDMPRQASIQALLLMTLYRFTSAKCGGRGVWVMLGQATRMAQDLGMHRNSARWSLPPLETEIRKRLWWACYVMDRWVCASFGRPIAIDDADCDVDYPSAVEQDYVDADGNAASPHENSDKIKEESSFFLRYFVEHIKLAKLVGLILRRIYAAATRTYGPAQVSSTVAELDTLLTKWLLDLPRDLRYDHQATTFNRWVAIIHSSYYTALILLHRPYMIPTMLTKANLSDSMPSLNICISAANSITHLAKRLDETDNLKYLWAFSSYELFTASLIHLTNSASIDMRLQTQSRNNLVTSILVLKRESARWFNATRVSRFLEDLMCAHLNFEEYKSEGRSMHPIVVANLTDEINVRMPIVLRDEGHPSGGSLLVAPKESTAWETPSSTVSTPNSSPSTPTTGAPMDTAPDGSSPGSLGPVLIPMRDVPPSSSSSTAAPSTSGASTTHPAVTPRPMKKSRKPASNSQRNSLLFNSSTPSPTAPPASVSATPDHPKFAFSSLSIPGMFTQGQAFPFAGVNGPTPGAPHQQPQQQKQPQQQQPQYQQQQPQQFQPQQAQQQQQQQQQQSSFQYSATPLFSSPLALQQQTATGSSLRNFPTQQQVPSGSQPPQHPQIQQLQQGGNNGFMQYQQQMQAGQGYPTSPQGGFIPSTTSAAQGYVKGMTGGEPPMRENNDYSNFSLFPQQDASAPAVASSTTGAGSPATTVAAAGSGASPMPPSTTAVGVGASPGLFQDPNVMAAVPNPFFGIPNTIDWDEWQQYISNAGLQKF